jgi:predicted nucleotidyltransferase
LSSKVFWPDRASVREALDRLARALLAREEVLGVYLCGSWAKETHTAASDIIDVLIVISGDTEYARLQPRDRIPACLPDRFPTGLDLFVFTAEEAANSAFARHLMAHALPLPHT